MRCLASLDDSLGLRVFIQTCPFASEQARLDESLAGIIPSEIRNPLNGGLMRDSQAQLNWTPVLETFGRRFLPRLPDRFQLSTLQRLSL